ncbi:MAG: ComF family protein [Candidatus Sungiibacteriota bacterium]|uniref:ComF family protein n=1 Tax=Candidatus Sungiibacteriota bacterium TaxID=2750080 RepID=A0A7T5RK66_9BACT|nr:MAG: ComF family protein [Candidatus Sungbacteria bacterium]
MISYKMFKNWLLDLIFPAVCFGCGTGGSFLCPMCHNKLRWIPPTCFVCKKFIPARRRITAGRTCVSCQKKSSIYAFLSPFSYNDEAPRELIHSLKYNRVRSAAPVLVSLLLEYFDIYGIFLPKEAVIMPIPLYKSRERVRGFNQSGLIATQLAELYQAKLGTCSKLSLVQQVLRKIKKTKPQIELSADKRRRNVIGTFGVADPASIKQKVVLLLDDVKTTGATLEEAARVLKEAGAKRVWAITVAH